MEANKFELIGRVNHIEMKYFDNGTVLTRTLIGKKGKEEGEFDTFGVNLFGKTAEGFGNDVKKGDYVYITGRVSVNKYTNKEGKTQERLELIGFEFKKVKFDVDAKKYVEDNTVDSNATVKATGGSETPW